MNYCQSCALCRQNCSTSPTFIHVGELHKPGLLGFINCSSHMVNCLFLWRVDGFFSELSVSISPFNCSSSLLSCHSPMRWKFSEKMRVLCTEHSCYQKPGHTGRGAGHWILVWNAKIIKVENKVQRADLMCDVTSFRLQWFEPRPIRDEYSNVAGA